MTKRSLTLPQQRALLLVILWLAFGLRFFRLGAQELRGDEAASWARITQEAGPIELFNRLVDEGQPHPPIHYWVLQAWERLLGDSEFALRSLSALLSVWVVALTYRVAQQLQFGAAVALIAAAITAVQPYQIWLGQDAKNMYQLSLIGVLLATLCLPGMLRGERRAWVGYVLGGAFAMLSHYYALFGLLAHGAYVLYTKTSWRLRARWMLAGMAIAVAVLPWALLVLPHMSERQFNVASRGSVPVMDFLSQTLGDAAVGPATTDVLAVMAAVIMCGLLALGVWRCWRVDRRVAGLLAAWVIAAVAGTFAVTRIRPTYNTFYMSNAYPAIYVLLAEALVWLWPRRAVTLAVSSLIVIGFAVSLNNYYFEGRYSKSRGLRPIAADLTANAQADDVLITNYPDPATVYYLRQITIPIVLEPPQRAYDPADVNAALDELAMKHDRVWVIPVHDPNWDATGFVEAQLVDRYVSVADWSHNRLRLRLFTAHPEAQPYYRSLNVDFESGVRLVGSYVTINGNPQPAQAAPGDWLRVTLVWSSTVPLPIDYTVFVHALDVNGRLVAQHDGPPDDGATPTSQWRNDHTVWDVHEFQVPPDSPVAAVEVVAGLYDAETGQRASIVDDEDNAAQVWRGEGGSQ